VLRLPLRVCSRSVLLVGRRERGVSSGDGSPWGSSAPPQSSNDLRWLCAWARCASSWSCRCCSISRCRCWTACSNFLARSVDSFSCLLRLLWDFLGVLSGLQCSLFLRLPLALGWRGDLLAESKFSSLPLPCSSSSLSPSSPLPGSGSCLVSFLGTKLRPAISCWRSAAASLASGPFCDDLLWGEPLPDR